MLRVAKPGTKIMIFERRDGEYGPAYKKNHFQQELFKDATVDLGEIEAAIPAGGLGKGLAFTWDGEILCPDVWEINQKSGLCFGFFDSE